MDDEGGALVIRSLPQRPPSEYCCPGDQGFSPRALGQHLGSKPGHQCPSCSLLWSLDSARPGGRPWVVDTLTWHLVTLGARGSRRLTGVRPSAPAVPLRFSRNHLFLDWSQALHVSVVTKLLTTVFGSTYKCLKIFARRTVGL